VQHRAGRAVCLYGGNFFEAGNLNGWTVSNVSNGNCGAPNLPSCTGDGNGDLMLFSGAPTATAELTGSIDASGFTAWRSTFTAR